VFRGSEFRFLVSSRTSFPAGVFALAALAGDGAFSFFAAGSLERRFVAPFADGLSAPWGFGFRGFRVIHLGRSTRHAISGRMGWSTRIPCWGVGLPRTGETSAPLHFGLSVEKSG